MVVHGAEIVAVGLVRGHGASRCEREHGAKRTRPVFFVAGLVEFTTTEDDTVATEKCLLTKWEPVRAAATTGVEQKCQQCLPKRCSP